MLAVNETMLIKRITKYGQQNYDEIDNNELSGDRSWEHCHEIFKKYRGQALTDNIKDLLCLHLAWYLASWGMLRNSCLRNFSYQIHKEAVEEIYKSDWDSLWAIDFSKAENEEIAKKIIELSDKLREIYKKILEEHKKLLGNNKSNITDTLQTKILLGTIGCVPAYDTYFKNALRITGIASNTYDEESLIGLIKFYKRNMEEFEKLQKDFHYPSAKVLDMCLFQYGYYASKVESLATDYFKTDYFKEKEIYIDCHKPDHAAFKRQLCLSVIHGYEPAAEADAQSRSLGFEFEDAVKWIKSKLESEKNKEYHKYFD